MQLEAEKNRILNFIIIARCSCSGVFRFTEKYLNLPTNINTGTSHGDIPQITAMTAGTAIHVHSSGGAPVSSLKGVVKA